MNKLNRLRRILRRYPGVVVAFSGGIDSTFLLKIAKDELAAKVIAVTAVSPLQPKNEIMDAIGIGRRLDVRHMLVNVNVLAHRAVSNNSRNRCYYCKILLFKRIKQIARKHAYVVIEATNKSDLREHRPGIGALKRLGIESPLMEAGFEKNEIRNAARRLRLANWNKPSMACLASRIPYGQGITTQRLQRIEKAENYLRRLNFAQIRVRDHYPIARIEVDANEFKHILKAHKKIVRYFHRLHYKYSTLDLAGYRTGSFDL